VVQMMERRCGLHIEADRPGMLTVRDVARMLNCSARTIYRLNDAGKMPKPVRLGGLVRWPRKTVESWITQGCPKAEKMEVSR